MKKTNIFISYNDVIILQQRSHVEFMTNFSRYVELFGKLDIQLTITPYYYYNAKFHTKARKKGSCMFFKIKLYPKSLTFEQAKNKHLVKEFFSHKIMSFTKTKKGYKTKLYSSNDKILKNFLARYLNRGSFLKTIGNEPQICLKESLSDIFRSFIFMYRYRNEVKTKYYGFDLSWIILIIALILIILEADAYFNSLRA